MKTKNNNSTYVESMGKKFKVRLLTKNVQYANEFMEQNPETAVIDETSNGIIVVANIECEK